MLDVAVKLRLYWRVMPVQIDGDDLLRAMGVLYRKIRNGAGRNIRSVM